MTTFKILGVNDDKDFCSCCGKQGLKRVVWIENAESGEINHFGTTCAGLKMKKPGGKAVNVEDIGREELLLIENRIAEKNWHIAGRVEFENAVAKELIENNVHINFRHIGVKSTAFTSFIWPYQRRQAAL